MRTYVVYHRGRIVGTVPAASDMEANYLVVTMWGAETRITRTANADMAEQYRAFQMDYAADSAAREAEIMYRIGREGR